MPHHYASSHLLAVLYFVIQLNDLVRLIIPEHDFEQRVEHALLCCEDSVGRICVSMFVFVFCEHGWADCREHDLACERVN